ALDITAGLADSCRYLTELSRNVLNANTQGEAVARIRCRTIRHKAIQKYDEKERCGQISSLISYRGFLFGLEFVSASRVAKQIKAGVISCFLGFRRAALLNYFSSFTAAWICP